MAPYREVIAAEVMEAPTRDGHARLEVAPRHTLLTVGELFSFSVTDRFATLIRAPGHTRRKQRAIGLDDTTRIVVARAVYSEEVGIWHQPGPGLVTRLFGLRPRELLDMEAMAASYQLDRLASRLGRALRPHGGGVERGVEAGRGADRVLIMDLGDRLLVHVRRLFRERPRLALEVHDDGTIVFTGAFTGAGRRRGETRIRCRSRFGVTAMGDYIRFADPSGRDLGALALPWIPPEDRAELVALIGERIHHED
jgi:hypothetical protein